VATPLPGSLFAFLFSDIEGSTARWEQNPAAMGDAVLRHDRLMRDIMAEHHGQIFKTVGDAFCVAFADVVPAVEAAATVQRALASEDFAAVGGLTVRIGIHAGPAECRDQDYFGTTLNRVARLMSAAHGGQIVLSAAAASMMQHRQPNGTSLTDLGRHRLKDLSDPEQIYQLEIAALPRDFPALRSMSATPNNLPRPATGFIGREDDLAEVTALLERHPLVTLLGPGGLGKTRLSIEVGAQALSSFPDGVWFVELAPLSDPELVAQTVADLFGLPAVGGRSALDGLAGFLRHKKLLLILDNCEHVVAAAATLADRVTRAAPGIRLLTSSREALGIPVEHVLRLPVLPVPASTESITAETALAYPSVQLFVARAASSLGGFTLTDQDAPSIAGICRRLDGIALALELAAPRLKMLKPAQLLARLDDRFKLLTGGSRVALPRQQTLRGLIDWSHDLLSEPERILLRRLSVFAHGWTLEAAANVGAGDGIEDWEIFDLLASLVDKSLVVADQSGAQSRFLLLETTRHYAREKLIAAGEDGIWARFARHMAALFREGDACWETASSEAWLAIYLPELDNLRAAIDWAFGPSGDPAIGVELTAYSTPLWRELGIVVEQQRHAERAVAQLRDDTPPGIAARVFSLLGMRSTTSSASQLPVMRQAVDAARQAGEPALLASCLMKFASCMARADFVTKGEEFLNEAHALTRSMGPCKLLASLYTYDGMSFQLKHDEVAARSSYKQSLRMARALGFTAGEMTALSNLAGSYGDSLDFERAIPLGYEVIAMAHAAGMRPHAMITGINLANTLLHAGQMDAASDVASSTLDIAQSLEDEPNAGSGMLALLLAAGPAVESALAAGVWGWIESRFRADQYVLRDEYPLMADLLDAALAPLEPAERDHLMHQGAMMTLDEAADAARRFRRA
jgi:predicted ATPase/class 3 adenylate cyclase